jgi:hypothetical protein
MPNRETVRNWALRDPEFFGQFARARDLGYDEIAEEIVEISDTPMKGQRVRRTIRAGIVEEEVIVIDAVDRSRLRCDTRWKALSKWSKRYSDKADIEEEKDDDVLKEYVEALRNSPKTSE